MDKYSNVATAAKSEQHDVASVAASLRDDFDRLIAIFDRHLSKGLDVGGEATLALSEAKCAAQRGLDLSHRLIGLLRRPV